MKKFVLMIAMLVASISIAKAQNYPIQVTPELNGQIVYVCLNQYSGVELQAIAGCNPPIIWETNIGDFTENPLILEWNHHDFYGVTFLGCGYVIGFEIDFIEPNVPNETTEEIWKRQGYPLPLEAIGADSLGMYDFHWNTGETTPTIEVTEPGIYTCDISDMCATATRSFIVKDNVEVYRATVDLETKLNKVTWQVTSEQAEYISEVRVERDGMGLGSAPYEQGYFMDNIGSENAARNYRLTAITTDGTECPITSYQKGTLHVDYSLNASNPNKLNMAWTPPFIEEGASIAVTYFQICKYDPATSEVTVVDQISANNTIGSYDVNLFDEGYAVVAAMFNEGKDYEDLAFSNLTEFLVGIEENEEQQCRVYPNPAKDRFTVEGRGMMHLTNVLGQEIMAKEIDGKEIIVLPKGLYFLKLGETTRKIMVE